MQDYSSPVYPSRAEQPAAALKKLPVRWVKNAAVLACIGVLGLGALAGCASPVPMGARCDDGSHGVGAVYQEGGGWYAENGRTFDVEVRAHWGGSGAGPFYVAYLTEQEALGIIRNRLCEAGACFDAPVPDYVAVAETDWSEVSARLRLFDARTRQGLVFPAPNWWDEFRFFDISPEAIEGALQREFTRRFDISATFMQNPGESMCDGEWWFQEDEPTFTKEEKQEAGQILEARLLRQIDSFIAQLRAAGMLATEQGA